MRRVGSIVLVLALFVTAAVVVSTSPVQAAPDIGPAPGPCPQMALGPFPPNHAHCTRTSEHASVTTDVGEVTDGTDITFTMQLNSPPCRASIADRIYPCVQSIGWDYAASTGIGYRLSVPNGTVFRLANGSIVTQSTQPGPGAGYYQPFNIFAQPNTVDEHGNIPDPTCIYGEPSPEAGIRCKSRIKWNPGIGPLPAQAWVIAFPSVIIATAQGRAETVVVETAFKFTSTPPPTPLSADFSPTQFGKAEFQFSPTVSGGKTPYAYHWDYGDGQTSEGALGGVLYTKPGRYFVTMTVTDGNGDTTHATHDVLIPAPELSVFTRLANGQPTPVKPGDTVDVELVVAADAEGFGDLTDVHFVDDPLFYDADRLELVSGPDPLIPPTFTLQPGEEEVFKYRFNAIAAGNAALKSEVAAVDGADRSVGDTSDGEIAIKDDVLVVTLTADPAELVQPEEQGQPPAPVDITVTIKLENTGDDDLTQVNLRSFGGERTQAGQLLPIEQTDGPVPDEISGLSLASIPAGGSTTLVAHFHTDDDADLEFSALATASLNGNRVDALGTVKVAIKAKYLLEFTSRVTNPPAGKLLDAGLQIRLEGVVRNLSNSAHLRIGPLYPLVSGNAGIATVKVDGEAPDPRELTAPEFVELDPGQTKQFTVAVMTAYSDPTAHGSRPRGGVEAKVEFTPWGVATLPDGTEVQIDSSNTKASEDSLAHRVGIDDSIPIPEGGLFPWAGTVTVGAVEGVWSAIASLPDMALGLITAPYYLLTATAEFQSEVWKSFTDEEKEALAKDAGFLAASILMRNAELGKQKFDDLWAQANAMAEKTMTDAQNQWEIGDWAGTARLYSSFLSNQIANIVFPIALGELAKSKAAVTAVTELNAKIQVAARSVLSALTSAERLEEVVPLLAQIPAGAILRATELAKGFGLSEEQAAALQKAAEELKVVLVMRSRQAASLDWIKELGAVLKPEALKIKTVNAIDKLLGYGDDIGRLVFKKPLALAEAERSGRPVAEVLEEMLANQGIVRGDPRYYQAMQRGALRLEEWFKYEKEYKSLSAARRIDVGFNYKDNGIPTDLIERTAKYRGFRLSPRAGASSEEYLVEMTNGNGEFASITGDIDGFMFSHPDGSPLTPAEHLKLLERLQKDFNIDLQHPETGTYLGDSFEELVHLSDREMMVQFAPGQEPRAVRFNLQHSDVENPANRRFKFDGGITDVGPAPVPPPEPAIPDVNGVVQAPPAASPPPAAAMLVGRDGNGPMAFGRCNLHYSTEPGARALRVEPDGTVTELADGAWEPTDLGETCWDDGPSVDITVLPVTSLTDGSAPGATELAIDTNPGYAPSMGAPSGFQVGQTITIDPGTPSEESAVLVGFGSLLVDRPLRLAHAADAPVVGAVFTAPATAPPATSAGTVAGVGAGSAAIAPKVITRVAGDDRIATAVAVSRRSFPASQSASGVVLARADSFADALAGTPLAARKDAPLLLTTSDSLDPRTLSEIQRVLAAGKTVFVLGGSAALSSRVEAALTAAHYVVVRLGGEDRFATAVTIAHDGLGDPATLLVADGRGFPDALSAGTAAAKAGGAVLLSNGASPAPATSDYLSRRGGLALISVGGPAAAAYPSGERIVGADRYDTSQMVASRFFTSPTTFGLASGTDFPDALSGGAGVARSAAPILLTAPTGLPTVIRRYLGTNAASILGGVLFGGDAAVSESPRVDAQDAIRGLR